MILFPSKWCNQEALCEGPAIITRIIKRETYGFYFAEMLKYQLPDRAVIAKFIRKHSLENATFKFIRSKFGKYIRIENVAYDLRAIRFMKNDDIIAKHLDEKKKKSLCTSIRYMRAATKRRIWCLLVPNIWQNSTLTPIQSTNHSPRGSPRGFFVA